MKVSELAAELEVPASAVIEQCQRFGINASWAGAELSGADVVVLRSELAGADEALDLTPVDHDIAGAEPTVPEPEPTPEPEPEPEPTPEPAPAKPVERKPLPPTAVGSMPDLIDEVTPEPEPEPGPSSRGPGFQMAGARSDDSVGAGETRSIPPREPPAKRRLDRAARNGLIALIVAVLVFVGSNYLGSPVAIAALWVLTAAALVVAFVDGIRGRRHVQTHPERLHGLTLSVITIILSVAGVIGLATAVVAVVQDAPAADAPLSVGDLASVQSARWGFQRVTRLEENGWSRPARDVDTCWGAGRREVREEERVEIPFATNDVSCDDEHTMQVAMVFAVNRDADAPYPGADALKGEALERCASIVTKINKNGAVVSLTPEYPTEDGWNDGDHDVVCMLVHGTRKTEFPT